MGGGNGEAHIFGYQKLDFFKWSPEQINQWIFQVLVKGGR